MDEEKPAVSSVSTGDLNYRVSTHFHPGLRHVLGLRVHEHGQPVGGHRPPRTLQFAGRSQLRSDVRLADIHRETTRHWLYVHPGYCSVLQP